MDKELDYAGGYCLVLYMTARDFQNEAKAKGHPWDNFLYIPQGWKMYERMNSVNKIVMSVCNMLEKVK